MRARVCGSDSLLPSRLVANDSHSSYYASMSNSENDELRSVGLKVTAPRVKILHILESSPSRHLSAEQIYRTLLESHDDIGLATVYRVLAQFETAGLITRHHFEGGNA